MTEGVGWIGEPANAGPEGTVGRPDFTGPLPSGASNPTSANPSPTPLAPFTPPVGTATAPLVITDPGTPTPTEAAAPAPTEAQPTPEDDPDAQVLRIDPSDGGGGGGPLAPDDASEVSGEAQTPEASTDGRVEPASGGTGMPVPMMLLVVGGVVAALGLFGIAARSAID